MRSCWDGTVPGPRIARVRSRTEEMACYGYSMTPIPIIARHAAVLLTLVALPMPLQADPITITGGMVEVDVVISDARIRLAGDNFLVRTSTDVLLTALVGDPFPTGTTLTLGGDWLFTGFRTSGEANVNGVHYPEVFFGLPTSGTFTTPSVTLTGGVEGLQTFTVPFTFNGVETGFASQQEGPTGEQPLFSETLVGSGTARAAFFGFRVDEGSPLLYQPTRLEGTDHHLEYVFSPSTPVPEPGTMALLGTGTLGLLAARRRRQVKDSRRPPPHCE
jgi:hypothetical protein